MNLTYSRPILCPVSHHATIGTHSAYGFAPRRSAAWSDVKACALLLMAFVVVIVGMTAAGLR